MHIMKGSCKLLLCYIISCCIATIQSDKSFERQTRIHAHHYVENGRTQIALTPPDYIQCKDFIGCGIIDIISSGKRSRKQHGGLILTKTSRQPDMSEESYKDIPRRSLLELLTYKYLDEIPREKNIRNNEFPLNNFFKK